jgi:predicted  nucleic acid-binding Zn-ribbon protein
MTPGLLDPLRPYFFAIRLALYAILIAFLFVSGCNYGKGRSAKKVDDLTAQIQACESANRANMDAISALTVANEAYARQSAKQAEAVAKAVKDAKRAQARAEKDLAVAKKELTRAYSKNQEWADSAVPSDIKRLLDPAR